MKNKRLLIIGSSSIHTENFFQLMKEEFAEIKLISDVNFSLWSLSAQLNTAKQIRKMAREFNPDIVHIHQVNSIAYYALKAIVPLDIPNVLTAWGSDIYLTPHRSFLLKALVRWNLKHADSFTADSKDLAEHMQALLPERKMEILIANFGMSLQPVQAAKGKVFYSNRLHKKLYRIDYILRAFAKFKSQPNREEWKLIVGAVGEETENLKALAHSLGIEGSTTFVGWLQPEDNANNYAKATYYISIPESDATSISVLEAMAYGCIPILSNLPSSREWISHGETGYIVEDVESDFISNAFAFDLKEASQKNKERIERDGTKDANRKKFLSLYEKLLAK
jgi:glycosyltransferase involved in cell wall biosynthesis